MLRRGPSSTAECVANCQAHQEVAGAHHDEHAIAAEQAADLAGKAPANDRGDAPDEADDAKGAQDALSYHAATVRDTSPSQDPPIVQDHLVRLGTAPEHMFYSMPRTVVEGWPNGRPWRTTRPDLAVLPRTSFQ